MKANPPSGTVAADRPTTTSASPDDATLTIDVIVRSQRWRQGVAELTRLCTETARRAYVAAGGDDRDAQISIVLTSDRAVQALNRTFRGHDQATNVLSFPTAQAPAAPPRGCPPPPRLLGDVVIAYGTTAAEAAAAGKDLGDHLRHLIVHGILHVLGYDHQTEGDAAAMERLEAAILARFGVSDPYASAAEHPA
jgi:probable rRNA maturation factor